MKKLIQLKNKDNENIDPINLNYEKRLTKLENDVYSTEEVKTNKKWIDGKPVYKKSYKQRISFTYTEENYIFGWINSGIENLGEILEVAGTINLVSRIEPLGIAFCVSYINGNRLQFSIPTSFGSSSGTISITLKYTKTTD